jgi:hypothetical protein
VTHTTNESIWTRGLPDSEWLRVTPGDEVRGVRVVAFDIRPSKFPDRYGNPRDEVVADIEVEGRPEKRWTPNTGALRALDAAHVKIGDTIDIIRGADRATDGGFTQSQWTITVRGGAFEQPKPVADAMAPTERTQVDREQEGDDDLPY